MKRGCKRLRSLLSLRSQRGLHRVPGLAFSDRLQYCPAERNQGLCGNCWVWASMGILEIDMAERLGIKDRLSIQYINSQRWCCGGGFHTHFADIVNSTRKVIPWTNANGHWLDGGVWHNNQSSIPASAISTNPSYAVDYMVPQEVPAFDVGRDVAIRNIKNVLNQGKAIYFGFVLPTREDRVKFAKFWATGSESDVFDIDFACGRRFIDGEGDGHAVLCVGYDDTDPKNRYWIMLNSWGAKPKRPKGIFRINMDMDYGGTYPYGDDEIIAFYWNTFDVHYAGSPQVRAGANSGLASAAQRQLYIPLGAERPKDMGVTGVSFIQDRSECEACNSSQVWSPITSRDGQPGKLVLSQQAS